jgi:hypothetical protein
MRIAARRRSVDTVFVVGDAFAVQEDSATGRLQQLKGRAMTAFFRQDSLRRFVAEPNGEVVYFRTDEAGQPAGALEASGDRIVAWFGGGELDSAKAYSGVEGVYYDESIVPQPLRLEGFIWTPEARPSKADLLDDRALRRLADPGRPLPGPPRTIPLDSLRPEALLPPPGTTTPAPPIPTSETPLGPAPDTSRVAPDSVAIDSIRNDPTRADTVRADTVRTDSARVAPGQVRADSLAQEPSSLPSDPPATPRVPPADTAATGSRRDEP